MPGEDTKRFPPRGPVIGPLVIAGIAIEQKKIRSLQDLGVRDSKTLSPNRRQFLNDRIKATVADWCLIELQPKEIDDIVQRGTRLRRLNYLEAEAMAKVIERLRPAIAYVDSSDVIAERFGQDISSMISYEVKIISEHHADQRYPVVSAASILAKVRRDEVIHNLAQLYGDFGSGYPSDQRTIRFLQRWFNEHGCFPDFVRKSWKTLLRIDNRGQQRL